jgi:hypothetical protein
VCLCSKGEIRGCFLSATGVGEPVEEDRSGWKIVQEELQPYAAADLGFLHASADLTSPPYWIPSPRPGVRNCSISLSFILYFFKYCLVEPALFVNLN